MAEIALTYEQAIETFCSELERFQICRASGFDVEQAAVAIKVSLATAIRYQRTIDRLMADLKTEAAPGSTLPGRPAAAPEKAHPNNHEGVIAP